MSGNKSQFILIGNGKRIDYLKKKYYDCVKFITNLHDQEEIFKKIDILIMTSKVENCSMAIMEAQVRGIPVIAPLVGGIPEIIEHKKTGFLVKMANPKEFIIGLSYVIQNYERISECCLSKQKCYSAEHLSDVLLRNV